MLCRLLSNYELKEFELASVANLSPVNAHEARTLVPSLAFALDDNRKVLADDELNSLLDEMHNYRL